MWYKQIPAKSDVLKKIKIKNRKGGCRDACISKKEDRLKKGRGFGESIKSETKKTKTNVKREKDDMTSANQTPEGYRFASLVTSQLWRADQHKPACFGLSSPWSFPSRSNILLHALTQLWIFLQQSVTPGNVLSLVPPSCSISPRPGLQSSAGRR